MPHLPSPSLNPEAYGTTVAASQAGIGETLKSAGEQLANHAIERLNQQREMDVYNAATEFRNQENIRAFGDPNNLDAMVTRKINGQDVQVPAGILNRQGHNAKGSYQEFYDGYMQDQQSFINSFQTPQQKMLAAKLANWDSRNFLDTAAQHEAKQTRLAFNSDNLNAQQSNSMQASRISDPQQIGVLMGQNENLEMQRSIYNGVDPKQEGKDSIDSSKTAVLRGAITGQIQDGNFQGASNLFEQFKEQISPESQETLTKYINSSTKQFQEESVRTDIQNNFNNRIGVIKQLLANPLDWSKANDIAATVSSKDPMLGEALQEIGSSKGGWFASKFEPAKKDEAFSDAAHNLFKLGTQKEISDFTVKALQGSADGKISTDRLAILVDAADQRGRTLPINETDTKSNFNQKQKDIDNAGISLAQWQQKTDIKDGNLWTRFFSAIKNGMAPHQAQAAAIKQTQEANNPASTRYKVGDIITNPKTGLNGEITGFNEKGVPLVKVKRGRQSSTAE